MLPRVLFVVLGLLATIGLAGCAGAGGGVRSPAAVDQTSDTRVRSSSPTVQTADVHPSAASQTVTFSLASGAFGSMTLKSTGVPAALTIGTHSAAESRMTSSTAAACPAVPPIVIANSSSNPVTITLEGFSVRLPCSVNGLLFGASAYQSSPVISPVVSTKLGDATGSGNRITFVPTVTQLTFPPNSALTISILPETSTAYTQLPAIANAATLLTSNAPTVPNSLSIETSSVQGGSTFESACYLPNDPAGPGLSNLNILGTPSFYCVLIPGQTGVTTTFGASSQSNAVTFTLGPNAKPDLSYVGLDGPQIFAPCTPTGSGQICPSSPFSIPVYSKAIVGNVANIAACVPAKQNTDCNGVNGNAKAPSASSVHAGQEFQLLLADDPTYNAANTFGGLTLQIGGSWPACAIVLGSDRNADAPPGYSDPGSPAGATPLSANYSGVGPYVEFDIKAKSAGTCVVNVTEDTGLKRTFAFQIAVQSGW